MADGGQGTFRRTQSAEYTVRILLECGCWTRARCHPMSDHVRLGCTSGQAHGYRKQWVQSEENGAVNINRTYAARQEALKTEEEKEETA